jgi:aminoacyl tRNA synthase complex-interacting multifunctional protein 1
MSAQAALSKLDAAVKDLVIATTHDGSQDFGKSEEDKAQVIEWIEKVAQGDITKEGSLLVWKDPGTFGEWNANFSLCRI